MKKLLFVLALGAFAACGNGDNAATDTDSANMTTTDTTTVVTPAPMDTTHMDSAAMSDSTKM